MWDFFNVSMILAMIFNVFVIIENIMNYFLPAEDED